MNQTWSKLMSIPTVSVFVKIWKTTKEEITLEIWTLWHTDYRFHTSKKVRMWLPKVFRLILSSKLTLHPTKSRSFWTTNSSTSIIIKGTPFKCNLDKAVTCQQDKTTLTMQIKTTKVDLRITSNQWERPPKKQYNCQASKIKGIRQRTIMPFS